VSGAWAGDACYQAAPNIGAVPEHLYRVVPDENAATEPQFGVHPAGAVGAM